MPAGAQPQTPLPRPLADIKDPGSKGGEERKGGYDVDDTG